MRRSGVQLPSAPPAPQFRRPPPSFATNHKSSTKSTLIYQNSDRPYSPTFAKIGLVSVDRFVYRPKVVRTTGICDGAADREANGTQGRGKRTCARHVSRRRGPVFADHTGGRAQLGSALHARSPAAMD